MAKYKSVGAGNDDEKLQHTVPWSAPTQPTDGSVDPNAAKKTVTTTSALQKAASAPSTATPAKTESSATTASQAPTTSGGFSYMDFAVSDAVNQAQALLQQQQGNRPGAYNPIWQDEADAYLSQYQNRGPYSYDVNSDALYQQYKDMYIQQGQMASMDAMGRAAAMTGGYGNSYAQVAGQQAYNQYLNQLNAVVPELAQMAHDRYLQEGQQMLDMYDLYTNRENQEYAKYQDNMDRWYQETARLQDNYDKLYDREYSEYMAGRNEAYDAYQRDVDRAYQAERDKIADEQWEKQYQLQKKASRGSGGGGNSYRSMSLDEQGTISKEFSRAGSIEAINDLVNIYTGMGYDPNLIAQMARKYAQGLGGKTGLVGALGSMLGGTLAGGLKR